jgi:hypothetical protein
MLKQMSKTGSSLLLILRSNVVPDVDSDNREIVVLVHDHIEPFRRYSNLISGAFGQDLFAKMIKNKGDSSQR